MKKILKPLAGILFTGFIAGIFLLVISLTFSALGRIFPDNFANQIIGLVLFDLAALAWGLAFVFRSESVMQYAFAALGFLVGLAGTVTMVTSEVMLSAADLTTPPDWVSKALVYGFIACAVIHLVLGYAHAATSPDVDAQIRLGAAQAEITSEAIRQAEAELESRRAALGDVIRPRLVAGIKRNLNLPISDDELQALDEEADIIEARPKSEAPKAAGIPVTLWNAIRGRRKRTKKPVTTTYEQRSDYALPCGHTEGAHWDKGRKTYTCNVCDEAWDINAEQVETVEAQAQAVATDTPIHIITGDGSRALCGEMYPQKTTFMLSEATCQKCKAVHAAEDAGPNPTRQAPDLTQEAEE